jgi:NAD(P)-dependent dehydrogenase (short-subunit alcohol dehydrogenase family)
MSAVARRHEGRVAFVTGAGSGIGRACAQRLAAEGASVIVTDLDGDAAAATAAPLGDAALAIGLDVTDGAALERAVAAGVERFGGLHLVHANAGVGMAATPVEELDIATWRHVIDVNLTGAFLTVRAALTELKRVQGAIVVTSSVSSMRSRDGLSPYIASKAGVNGLVHALAFELAPDRVRVNAVLPGPVATPVLMLLALGETDEETVAVAESGIPLGAMITPERVAAAVAYLLSDEAADVTGVLLPVDGGRTA